VPEVAGTDSHFQQEFFESCRNWISFWPHLRSQVSPEHLLKAKDLLSDRTTFMLGGAPKGMSSSLASGFQYLQAGGELTRVGKQIDAGCFNVTICFPSVPSEGSLP